MPELFIDHMRRKGPLFHNPTGKTRKFVDDSNRAIAEEAKQRILMRLSTVLKNPTGDYESDIQISPVMDDFAVNDNQSVKGGWLEGISPRNKTTRFKGYHVFRTVRLAIERELPHILRPHIQKLMQDLNG